jgi:hypothetical protein
MKRKEDISGEEFLEMEMRFRGKGFVLCSIPSQLSQFRTVRCSMGA